jgi:ABC-type ATPase involved in cell division
MNAPPAIECRDLTVAYPSPDGQRHVVLDAIRVRFPPARIALITGPTGAGKSTLLHTLAGLIRPTAGEVIVGDAPVSRWRSAHRDLWRRKVGVVFQQPSDIADLTVLENVLLPMVPAGGRLADIRQRAMAALESVAISHLAGSAMERLSGGERQRVSIARALINRPVVLLADEPTAHQDDDSAQRVLNLLARLQPAGVTVVIAAHDPRVAAASIADDRYRLAGGVLERASP